MKNRLVSLFVIATLLLGTFAFSLPAQASPTALKVVDPTDGDSTFDFWSNVKSPGDTFDVSIIIEDVPSPGFYGWEFTLSWTPGIIDCVSGTLNTGIWAPYNTWVPFPIDNTTGTYHQSMTGQAPAVPQTGTWWLVNLTFQIVAPAPYMGVVSTGLTLSPPLGADYCIADNGGVEIPHEFVNGNYNYHWAPPTLLPYLSVVPQSTVISGKNINKAPVNFTIDIYINDVDPGWNLAGIEFVLRYNTSVLDVLEVTQGDFLEPFTTTTWFYSNIDEAAGTIQVAYTILDIPGMTAPFGSGKVATIKFNATAQEKFPISVYSDFDLEVDYDAGATSYFANYVAEELPYDPAENGTYELKGFIVGRVIDVYTQYPYPYGGQDQGMPSDMFWPQKEVNLTAYVTYNEWPVQNKDVTFEVRAPDGTIMAILVGRTNSSMNPDDATGYATVSFRMNWPCANPEDLFGVWNVTATVDIACIVVNDTVEFHYDYLVHWYKVTTNKDEYKHCENIIVTVEFGSHSQQYRNVTIAMTLTDELNYPVITGTEFSIVTVGGAIYCQLKNYTTTLTTHVDKSVAAGEATIHVVALTDLPHNGGYALCPEITKKINILASWV
jgi:hypothetical protein